MKKYNLAPSSLTLSSIGSLLELILHALEQENIKKLPLLRRIEPAKQTLMAFHMRMDSSANFFNMNSSS